jgi:hypothetical protein
VLTEYGNMWSPSIFKLVLEEKNRGGKERHLQ